MRNYGAHLINDCLCRCLVPDTIGAQHEEGGNRRLLLANEHFTCNIDLEKLRRRKRAKNGFSLKSVLRNPCYVIKLREENRHQMPSTKDGRSRIHPTHFHSIFNMFYDIIITSGYEAMQPLGASALTSTSPMVRLGSRIPWKRPLELMYPPAERNRFTSAWLLASWVVFKTDMVDTIPNDRNSV